MTWYRSPGDLRLEFHALLVGGPSTPASCSTSWGASSAWTPGTTTSRGLGQRTSSFQPVARESGATMEIVREVSPSSSISS